MLEEKAEFEAALWETVGHLQTLIRLDTVNPPGNEIAVARYLEDVFRGAGIRTRLYQPAPGRAALVARVKGTGQEPPVILMAHMDVVGVEREKWSVQPFGGEILDGYLYGRGAIDDKGMLATNLQAMLLAHRRGGARRGKSRLNRDLIFLATSDEEAGGKFGIHWVLENVPALKEAEFALNEGGRIRIVEGRPLYAAVQCAEKVPHMLTIRATGPGGHAALPHRGNAIERLSLAVAKIANHTEPLALSPTTRSFFAGLSTVWPDAVVRRALADVASTSAERIAAGARRLRDLPQFNATLRTGISTTIIAGGTRGNVIPTEASARLNVRTLPGQSVRECAKRLDALIADPAVTISVDSSGRDAPVSSTRSKMFRAIGSALSELSPETVTVPYLSAGATDSAALRAAGVACYGLLPFPLTQADEERMHGHDERVGVDALGFGVRLTTEILDRVGERQ